MDEQLETSMNDDSDKKLHKQALQQLAGLFTK
jgi:hypothetical protein